MPVSTRSLGVLQGKHASGSCFLSRFYRLDSTRYPCLLASTSHGTELKGQNTQYDLLLAHPQYTLTLNADRVLHFSSQIPTVSPPVDSGFFDALDYLCQQERTDPGAGDSALPFHGGWFVYLGYEMAMEVEPCLDLPVAPGQPLAVAHRHVSGIVHDKQSGELTAVAEPGFEYLLDELERDYRKLEAETDTAIETGHGPIKITGLSEQDEAPYLEQVERIKRYIIDGDIFQANLSRLWQVELDTAGSGEASDYQLFSQLAENNPSSFAALVNLGDISIISSSPERLVRCIDGTVETRPIAGTRPRHAEQSEDRQLADELIAHPKERAEHIMLIDLERNDLGRVCKAGSIEVDELMTIETWQHVHHIVSNIRGTLSEGKTPVDILRAVFPGGTITGCPKVRCIEILAEMEAQPRAAYTGSLGYINTDGSMDFNILIRTLSRQGSKLTFRAGGGIVSDSIASKELEETRAKAKGLLRIFDREHE